jgi:hypothetical protein
MLKVAALLLMTVSAGAQALPPLPRLTPPPSPTSTRRPAVDINRPPTIAEQRGYPPPPRGLWPGRQ